MTFQFLCPQGHLLQGEEAHMGMQCQCPQCGVAFIIPTIQPAAAPAPVEPELERSFDSGSMDLAPFDDSSPNLQAPAPKRKAAPPEPGPSDPGRSDLDSFEPAAPKKRSKSAAKKQDSGDFASQELGVSEEEQLLHIPCPNGHELDVPLEYLGARAMCPHCGAQFRLKREKSLEWLREQEIIDRKRAQFWFQLAIVAGGIVVVMVVIMIVATMVS